MTTTVEIGIGAVDAFVDISAQPGAFIPGNTPPSEYKKYLQIILSEGE